MSATDYIGNCTNFDVDLLENRRLIKPATFLFKIIRDVIDCSYLLSLLVLHVPQPNFRGIKPTLILDANHYEVPYLMICLLFSTMFAMHLMYLDSENTFLRLAHDFVNGK